MFKTTAALAWVLALGLTGVVGQACKPGTYPVRSNCPACPPGYFCDGTSLPQECGPGTYAAGSAPMCSLCQEGTFSDEYGAASCKGTCPAGTSNPPGSMDGSTCTPCLAGTYSQGGTACLSCDPGSVSQPGSNACTQCLAGTYESPDGTACLPCDPGSISPDGSTACTQCPAGTYESPDGTACLNCDPGTSSPAGSTSAGMCVMCQTGTYSPGGTACMTCDPGSAPSADATTCTQCPADTYSPDGTACLNCDSGSTSLPGSTMCTPSGSSPCPPGEIGPGGSACQPCPAGTFNMFAGAMMCCQCCAGTYSLPGAPTCTPCPASVPYSLPGSTSPGACTAVMVAVSPPSCNELPGPPIMCPVVTGLTTSPKPKLKRNIELCSKFGQKSCPTLNGRPGSRECVDITRDLWSCGGCMDVPPSEGGGIDCTAIPDVYDVICEQGRCIVSQCRKGYNVSEDGSRCVPIGRSAITYQSRGVLYDG